MWEEIYQHQNDTTAKKSSLQPLGSQSNTKHFYVDRSILHAVPLMQQFLCDLQPRAAQHQSTKPQPQQVAGLQNFANLNRKHKRTAYR